MTVAVVYSLILIAMFGAVYITKRRFGVLGLALAAGSLLSTMWAHGLTEGVLKARGGEIDPSILAGLVAAGLVLAPAIVLLSGGPTYKSVHARVVGGLLFAVLAVALVVEPLQPMLVLEGDSRAVYEFLVSHNRTIVTIGLLLAIADLLVTRTPKPLPVKGKH